MDIVTLNKLIREFAGIDHDVLSFDKSFSSLDEFKNDLIETKMEWPNYDTHINEDNFVWSFIIRSRCRVVVHDTTDDGYVLHDIKGLNAFN